jgi:hypothetical protein
MKGFNPYLKAVVCISASSYTHLTDLTIRAFATAYATLSVIIDDYFMDEPGPISVFNSHLIQGMAQEHPLLEVFARLLRELPKYWDPIMSDIMRQSAMTFITSFLVERQVQNTNVSFHSSNILGCSKSIHPQLLNLELARSVRTMTGTSLILIMFAFPSGTPPEIYLTVGPVFAQPTQH